MRTSPAVTLRRLGQSNKARIRSVSRLAGYDIVRFRTSTSEHVAHLVADCRIDGLIDVGANEGQYAQRMRAYGFGGAVISFEPGAAAFRRLSSAAAKDRAWECRMKALGRSPGETELFISENSVSSSTLAMTERHVAAAPESVYVARETVEVSTLDAELGGVGAEALWLKVDVQGAELEVLAGGPGTLQRTQIVEIELSLAPLYEGQPLIAEVIQRLSDLGFNLVQFEPGLQNPDTGDLLQGDGIFKRRALVP